MTERLILAALAPLVLAGAALAADPDFGAFDRRLTDVEKRLAAVERQLTGGAFGPAKAEAAPACPCPAGACPDCAPGCGCDPTVSVFRGTAPRLVDGEVVTGDAGGGVVVWTDGKRSVVATAKHVVPDPGTGVRVTAGGKTYPARLLAAAANVDLSLLAVDAPLPAAAVGPNPGAGAAATLRGYTTGAAGVTTAGVREVDGFPYGVGAYASAPGDSGSGLFDRQGRLVGVHCGYTEFPDGRLRKFVLPSVVAELTDRAARGEFDRPVARAAGGACPTGTCPNAVPAGFYTLPALGGCPTGQCPNVR